MFYLSSLAYDLKKKNKTPKDLTWEKYTPDTSLPVRELLLSCSSLQFIKETFPSHPVPASVVGNSHEVPSVEQKEKKEKRILQNLASLMIKHQALSFSLKLLYLGKIK